MPKHNPLENVLKRPDLITTKILVELCQETKFDVVFLAWLENAKRYEAHHLVVDKHETGRDAAYRQGRAAFARDLVQAIDGAKARLPVLRALLREQEATEIIDKARAK